LLNEKPDLESLPLSLGIQLYRLLGPILLDRSLLRAVCLFFIDCYPLFAKPELKDRKVQLFLVLDVAVFEHSDFKLSLRHLDEL
jgi:hypothetical protein